MPVRLYEDAGRLIISKPGYSASPSLADERKLFDSNWYATGMIMATGTVQKTGGQQLVIPFPFPLHYVPAADVMWNKSISVLATVTASSITIPAAITSGTIDYTVWAVSA